MPIIKLTQEALARLKEPEQGWSYATITSVRESPSNKKDSTNYWIEFLCESGPGDADFNKGRSCVKMLNSKTLGMHSLESIYRPAIEQFVNLMSAAIRKSPAEIGQGEYEMKHLEGKSLWIKITNVPDQNGNLKAEPNDFLAEQPDGRVPF
jgi:hypothetical protein